MKNLKTILLITAILLGANFLSNNAFAQNYGNTAGSAKAGSLPIAEHFEGGKEALLKTIKETIVYPPSAKRNRRQGECIIHITLQEDGSIQNAKIVKEIGAGTGEEALRVVKTLKFNAPGYIAEYNIPVNFKL